jgi:hypothetical protein
LVKFVLYSIFTQQRHRKARFELESGDLDAMIEMVSILSGFSLRRSLANGVPR